MVLYHYMYVFFQKILFAKYSENSKNMVVLVYHKDILNEYNAVWDKIKDLLKKQFNSELIYEDNDKHIRTKVDLHNTPFLNKNKYKNKCYAWISFLLLKSIVNINSKYYPVVFSNECKYIANKQEMKIISENHNDLIVDDSDDEYDKFK